MISAKPTYATQTLPPVETETATAPAIPTTPRSNVTLTFEPATPETVSTTAPPSTLATSRVHQRQGSGFPFSVPDLANEPEDSPSTDTFESTRAIRRPTDPSTLNSFDSARAIRIPTPPSSVTGPSSITGSFESTRAGPRNPSIPPSIPDESEAGTNESDDGGNGKEENGDGSDDEGPGDAGMQRFQTALE